VAGAGLALGATLGIAGTAQAADFTVTNLNDSGAGSLRQAVLDANNNPGADRVLFQSGLSGTIDLTSNQLSISDPLDIQGPGAGTLTVRGTGTNRVAYVFPGDGQSVTVSGLTLSGNGNGTNGGVFWSGGVASSSNLTITNSVLTGSHAGDDGGAVYVYYGSLQIESTTISGNSADNAGGGIYFHQTDAPSAIRNSTISGNTVADVGFADGGGVYINDDEPTQSILIENSTITGNSAPDRGGGIYDFSNSGAELSTLTLESSTVSGNTAGNFGGGLYQYYGTTIRNTIIADNSAPEGVDLSGPTGPPPQEGHPANVAFSLIENPGSPLNETGPNLFGVDPQLGGLASNGGATQTQALSATSPAVDKGSTSVGRDQRGSGRPFDFEATANAAGGNGADIGAFELLVPPTCKGRPATVFATTPATHKFTGTNKADVIVGTNGKDKIKAKGGNDLVCALGGKDTVKGGKGKDTLLGGPGKDKLIGGPGKDKLKGGKGKDVQKQ
jgi:hypothetical protein